MGFSLLMYDFSIYVTALSCIIGVMQVKALESTNTYDMCLLWHVVSQEGTGECGNDDFITPVLNFFIFGNKT